VAEGGAEYCEVGGVVADTEAEAWGALSLLSEEELQLEAV